MILSYLTLSSYAWYSISCIILIKYLDNRIKSIIWLERPYLIGCENIVPEDYFTPKVNILGAKIYWLFGNYSRYMKQQWILLFL